MVSWCVAHHLNFVWRLPFLDWILPPPNPRWALRFKLLHNMLIWPNRIWLWNVNKKFHFIKQYVGRRGCLFYMLYWKNHDIICGNEELPSSYDWLIWSESSGWLRINNSVKWTPPSRKPPRLAPRCPNGLPSRPITDRQMVLSNVCSIFNSSRKQHLYSHT